MPELPEVETVARQLAPLLNGRTVRGLRIYDDRLRNGRIPRVAGRKIRDVSRSGKQVLIELTRSPSVAGPLWLAVHLRMTGRLQWVDGRSRLDRTHLRARIGLDRGALVFIDTRRFGTMRWYRSRADADPAGVDPLSSELTPRRLIELIGGSEQNAKAWLLRQDRLVGLGNIYASEILHAARISPQRPIGSLAAREARSLHAATRRTLERAIRNCGTTFSDFQDARGMTGSYQNLLAVYGREGEPCGRCGATIERRTQQQRSTFYCPVCQE